MRRIMLLTWLGFASASAGLFGAAVALDYPKWPATQCQAKWAHEHLTTRWRWGAWCMVYADGAWVSDVDSQFRPKLEAAAAK
jgi:hypothetical protein